MATVGINGLILIRSHTHAYHSVLTCFVLLGGTKAAGWRQRSRVTGTVAVDGDRTHRSVASSTYQHNINIAWPSTLLGPSLNDDDTCMSVCLSPFILRCMLPALQGATRAARTKQPLVTRRLRAADDSIVDPGTQQPRLLLVAAGYRLTHRVI